MFTMIKQICLVAMIAIGLTLLIPGTNVEAKSSHHHLHSTEGIGFGIGAIAKFKQHKENPTQIHIGKGGAPMPYA
jgi:L-asparagine transporter-like permease